MTTSPEMTDTQYRIALLSVLGRIADALEAQHAEEDQTITMALGDFKVFDWASIGARVLNSDEHGTAQVWHEGKVYTRRTNDKFGTEIWFSRGNGKNPDGTAKYHRLITFKAIAPAEPIGRKTEQALNAAQSTQSSPTGPMKQSDAIPSATSPTPQAPADDEPAEISLDKAIELWNDVATRAQRAGKRDVVQANGLKAIRGDAKAIVEAARKIEAALK